ncbi:transcriptional activator [Micromonospora sp. M71_S20]|uniref:BTAD domain-containing putative transcriptional regulator n=1 Tax=Micromonospora sp. M71_S20 TaxID=592872 RepID=UPI000F22B912|nr:BTAD domain-containing putative transcriptional regulator [Micromonospora sp. M71_S20]RLK23829.1 transcriptional activator [Micromonospora sp. M71_S20]
MTSRAARILAIATSALSTTAVPLVLAVTGTWTPALPAPGAVRQWIVQPISADFIAALAVTVATALWLLLSTAIFTHAYRALSHQLRWTAKVRLPGPIQSLTAALLGATAVTTVAGATAHAAPVTTSGGDLPAAEPTPTASTPPTRELTHPDPPRTTRAGPTYTVNRGDSLCRIAERTLGDADRWPEIYALNRGTHFPRVGGTLRDPDLIHPGWTLDLPADATPPTRTPSHPPPRKGPPHTQPPPQAPQAPPTSPEPATSTPRAPTASPQTTTAPSRSAEAPTPSAPDTASPATHDTSRTSDRTTRGVWLPNGSWVDLSLALAIAAAVALVWAHRRRRYVPREPTAAPHMNAPALAPMPQVVKQILRGLRRAAGDNPTPYDRHGDHDDDAHDLVDEPPPSGTSDGSEAQEAERQGATARPFGDGGQPAPPLTLDDPPSALWPSTGLELTGPGAEAAARGLLTAALAADGAQHPEVPTEVIVPSTTAVTLLGTAALTLPHTPRLTITASVDEALELLEAQAMRRARLLHQHEVDSVTELRRVDPYEEPLPPVILLAGATNRRECAHIAGLLAQGKHLDIHGVLLGTWPENDTATATATDTEGAPPTDTARLTVLDPSQAIVVAADGTTSRADGQDADHRSYPADIGRLAVLTPTETIDLLATLAESHTGQPHTPAPIEAASTAAEESDNPARPTEQKPPSQAVQPKADIPSFSEEGAALPASGPGPVPAATTIAPTPSDSGQTTTTETAAATTRASTATAPDADTTDDGGASDSATTRAMQEPDIDGTAGNSRQVGPVRVEVTVLGPAAIADVPPGPTLRKKALEVLVYLAVHDGNASAEAILDDLLPDAPANKAPGRLYTYVSDLRATMRRTAGPGTYLTHPNHRYALDRDMIDVDLWRMRAAIRDANQATDPSERLAALRRAVDTYGGHLAEGADYEWIEPYREAIRQQALDAYLALADALAGNPAEQLPVLDTAIRHNPYAEELYQQAMRARAALGHLDAIRALRRTLTRALSEIDAEPSDETMALADQLVAQTQRPTRRSDLRPGPQPGDGAAS